MQYSIGIFLSSGLYCQKSNLQFQCYSLKQGLAQKIYPGNIEIFTYFL